MSITIGRYGFTGPFKATSQLEDKSGVYAILTLAANSHYNVVDIGESATVKSRVESHDRKSCWQRNAINGDLYYAAYYTPGSQQAGRMEIEQELRKKYDPPCGKI